VRLSNPINKIVAAENVLSLYGKEDVIHRLPFQKVIPVTHDRRVAARNSGSTSEGPITFLNNETLFEG
jgi:hypothetical protein